MPYLTDPELQALKKVLADRAFQNLIGAEEWDLTESEEVLLWQVINKLGKDDPSAKTLIVCHIRTGDGARFSVHSDLEDLRKSLIEYFNEVMVYDGVDEMAGHETLEEVIEAIEEQEDVSWEQIELGKELAG